MTREPAPMSAIILAEAKVERCWQMVLNSVNGTSAEWVGASDAYLKALQALEALRKRRNK